MDVKGQVSVEYLLLVLVILIILTSVTIPLVGNSISASSDVSKVSDAKNAIDNIANAVNLVYANGPGAKRTLSVYIPVDTSITYNNNLLSMPVTGVKENSTVTTSPIKNVNATVQNQVSVSSDTITKGWHKVVVEWKNGNAITVTVS